MSEESSQATQTTESSEQTTEATQEATTESHDGETQTTTSYLDGKYDSVSALESGYKELQSSYSKKLGAFVGSPDAYELAEGVESSARIEALMEFGKENQISNDALNAIIQSDITATEAENKAYVDNQREALGKDADARINNVVDWARANLGEDAMETLNSMVTSAKGVEMFEAIAKLQKGTAPAPAAQQKQAADKDTINQMRFAKDEFGGRKMSSDPTYRAKVEGMEAELYGNR